MDTILQNKDILSYILQYFNKTTDKQTIFNIALCNKRTYYITKLTIIKHYTFVIKEENQYKISPSYESYRIGPWYDHTTTKELFTILDNLNSQTRLDTLKALNVDNIFAYINKSGSKTLDFLHNLASGILFV